MGISDFQILMLPLLKFANDQQEHASRDAADYLAQSFQLSDTERYDGRPHVKRLRSHAEGMAAMSPPRIHTLLCVMADTPPACPRQPYAYAPGGNTGASASRPAPTEQ